MPTNMFELTPWKITGGPTTKAENVLKFVNGKPVKLTFKSGEEVKGTAEKTVTDGKFTHDFTVPKVPDDKASYPLAATAEYNKLSGLLVKQLPETVVVWPTTYKVTVKTADGTKQVGVEVTAEQGGVSLGKVPTNVDGVAEFKLRAEAGAVTLKVAPPFMLQTDTSKLEAGKLRSYEAIVKRMITPKFVKITNFKGTFPPAGTDPIKVYVNLDPVNLPSTQLEVWGNEIEIEVGAKDEGSGTGKKDDVIYLQAKFGGSPTKSKRNDPKTELKDCAPIAKTDSDNTQTGEAKLPDDNQTVKFKVNLGLAGGDTCEIRLSGIKDDFPDTAPTVKFVNWRRLGVDMVEPAAEVSTFALRKFGTGGLAANQKQFLKSELEKVFVEFDVASSQTFGKSALPDNGKYNIVDSEFVGLPAGGKLVVVGIDQMIAVGDALRGTPKKLNWYVLWFDHMWLKRTPIQKVVPMTTATANVDVADASVYKFDPVKADGSLYAWKIEWQCTEYQDGTWKPLADGSNIATDEAKLKFGTETVVNDLTQKRTISSPNETDLAKYLTLVNHQRMTVTLPTTDPADPGNFLSWTPPPPTPPPTTTAPTTTDSTTTSPPPPPPPPPPTPVPLKIVVTIQIRGVYNDTNAAAGKGAIYHGCGRGAANALGLMEVLYHEMGHNMGLGYGAKDGGVNGGHTGAAIGGVAFEAMVPAGDFYSGRDHNGGHCAAGLSVSEKGSAHFGAKTGTCNMWGSANMANTTARPMCDKCANYLRALDMKDISRAW